ncbi:MAG: hypothetical protein ACI970_000934 [Myxococcota bacterium]
MDDRIAAVLAEGPPEVNGVLQRVLDFLGALRRAGVPTALSEGIDAVRLLQHVDLMNRTMLREALAASTIRSTTHRAAFDDLFELYFPARIAGAPTPLDPDAEPSVMGSGDQSQREADQEQFVKDLMDKLLEGDDASVRQMARDAVEQFGRVDGRDGGTSYFQYRVLRAVDLQQLLRELLRERASDEDQITPLQERLWRDEFEARIEAFRQEIESEIRRRAAEQRGRDQVADRATRPPLEEVDFLRLSPEEQTRMRGEIRPLARKLATRVSVKRKHGRDGRLDVRKTVRRSLMTGGVPFEPAFKPRKPHKPELWVVCDVSGSVAAFARFTLLLTNTLQEQFSKVRSFAFIDTLDEVTGLFERHEFDEAVKRMVHEAELVWLDGHSDYGHSFKVLHERYADEISPRATVLILGDGRNNYRQTNAWVLADLQKKARHVYWLNPEPLGFWDTGDSVMASYARYCDEVVEVRNLKQLGAFVQKIAT